MPAARHAVERRGCRHLHRARHRAARRRPADRRGPARDPGGRRAGADVSNHLRRRAHAAALRLPSREPAHAGAGRRRLSAHPRRRGAERNAGRPGRARGGGDGGVRAGVRRVRRRARASRRRPPSAGAYPAAAENPPSRRPAIMHTAALLHLLQFASPALPIGAYSYSQGLETALESGAVHNAETARVWILRHLHEVVARWEAPVALWSERFIASRDSAEFRAETIQMGFSLTKLIAELGIADAAMLALLQREPEVALPTAFACAVDALQIPHDAALLAMLFAWAENQVLVCVKSVPLGQVAGQRLLLSLRPELEAAARYAQTVADEEMSNWAPGLSLLSMQHEVQYSRLYRS